MSDTQTISRQSLLDDARLQQKLHMVNIATWVLRISSSSAHIAASAEIQNLLGYSAINSENNWDELVESKVHPDDREFLRQEIAASVSSPEHNIQIEYRIWNERQQGWHWIFIFGSRDSYDAATGTAVLSGGIQDRQSRRDSQRLREHQNLVNDTLIANLPGSYLIAASSEKIVRWNELFQKSFSLHTADPSECSFSSLFLPEVQQKAQQIFHSILITGAEVAKLPALRSDGSRGIFTVYGRRFVTEEEPFVLALLFDSTEAEATQIALEKERTRLDAVLDAAHLGIWDWNVSTGKAHFNKIAADLLGVELSAIQGSTAIWEKVIAADDYSRVMAAMEAHFRGETEMFFCELRLQQPDGKFLWVQCRGRVVERDANGVVMRVLGMIQDIDDERKTQLDLLRSKNQLKVLENKMGLGTWDWNLLTNEILFNDTFFSILGYPEIPRDSSYEFWLSLIHPDDLERTKQTLNDHFEGRTPEYACEIRMRHRGGHYIWTYDVGRAIAYDEDGKPLRAVGGHFDIDKRKRADADREVAMATIAAQKQELEETIEERTAILRGMHARVDSILASTGQSPTQAEQRAESKHVTDLLFVEGEKNLASFVGNLNAAFDVITGKMWWYKNILDSIPFPLTISDMAEQWLYLNDPALDIVGASSLGDLAGTPAFWWDDGGKSNGEPIPLEDGTTFNRYHPRLEKYFQGQVSRLYDYTGRQTGHVVAMQDITKLHEADERTRIMLDATPLACNFWNSSFENIDCNLEAAKLFNLSGKQEYLDRFFELSPKYQPCGTLSAELAHVRISTAFREGYCKFEWLHQQLDGSPVPSEITLVRVEYGQEHIVLGYTRDLRELKRKEAEVDKERQLLLKIMESSPVCFAIWVDSIARFATPFATDFLGIEVGKNSASFFVDPVDRESFLEELRQHSSVSWRIVSIQGADGAQHEMLANAFVAEYFDEPCVMTWLLDVTEMRETERQLRLARDVAEENTRAKGDFLANMSHEIRTPMNAILGMTRMVLETDLTPQQHGYLQKAEQSGRALLRILNDILDFSKIEAGKLEMEIAPFQLGEVLQGVIDMFSDTIADKELYLTLDIDPCVPQSVQGDALRLHQVLVNLVSNALKFTSEGGIRVRVWVESLQAAACIIRFSVRDTGIGLTKEQQEKMFMAFSQADTSTTRKYGGTGLGLAISKRLVEMMDGTIHCTSEQGKGAEFSFSATFLIDGTSDSSKQACLLQREWNHDAIAHLRGSRILVAEDNEINQIIAQELLEKAGFIVDLASNGREAAEKAASTYYDLVFMDIQMPEMDGFAATRELRKHAYLAKLPIVAMTAHAMVGDKEKSLAGGMNDHITKPIDQNEVFKTIARWVKEPLHLQATFETRMGAGASPAMVSPVQENKVTELPSSLPGIDVASGLPRVAGNKKLFVKLLRRIADEAPSTQEKISAAIMAGDITAVKEIAHSLKGSASNLSIIDVTKAAEGLEAAAKAEDFPLLLTHLDALEKAYEQYVAVVATLEGL